MSRDSLAGAFRIVGPDLPNVLPRESLPIRAYVYTEGYREMLRTSNPMEGAARHLSRTYSLRKIRGADYAVALIWADIEKVETVIEIYAYSFRDGLPLKKSNPFIEVWNDRDGMPATTKDNNYIRFSGDSLLILAEEERLRRSYETLDEYFKAHNLRTTIPSSVATAIGCSDQLPDVGFQRSELHQLQIAPFLEAQEIKRSYDRRLSFK